MYTLSERSYPLNVFFAIFAGYLWQPQWLTVKQDTFVISCWSAISSKRSKEVGPTDAHLVDFIENENVSVRVFSWVSEDNGKSSQF